MKAVIDRIHSIIYILSKSQHRTMLASMSDVNYGDPFKILISTILSARAKDSATIPIANRLFRKYKTPEDFVAASVKALEKEIRSIGFYKTKACRIRETSRILIEQYHGKVPRTVEELLKLPGVGRKTANCVLVYAFREPAIPVDTHVHRISNRLGIVKTKNPKETELALMKIVPRKLWIDVNEVLVSHGQTTCTPASPRCSICPVYDLCERRGVSKSR